MSRKPRIPSYRLHRASGQAVVVLNHRSLYLGKFGTPESKAEYRRVIAEWLANQRRPLPTPAAEAATPSTRQDLTVTELAVAYWQHTKEYYVKDGQPTSEQDIIRQVLRFVRQTHGSMRAVDFGPLSLKAVREAMIRHPITRKVKVKDKATGEVRQVEKVLRVGLARRVINKHVSRIRGMFKWAAANEMLPITVYQALATVAGLRKDRSTAREKEPVCPVADAGVKVVLPHLPVPVRTMVQVQRLCGGRPQDVVEMRPCDIDRSGPVWEYRPNRHKTEHHGRGRVIFLGPRAQMLLKPCLEGIGSEDYVFSPRRAEQARLAARRRQKGLPENVVMKDRGRWNLRDRYDAASYRRAVRRACEKAGIPTWSPLQLRHTAGTLIRKQYGLEASQAVLGHAELTVTQVYSEVDLDAARKVMAEIG
jgi:integrase